MRWNSSASRARVARCGSRHHARGPCGQRGLEPGKTPFHGRHFVARGGRVRRAHARRVCVHGPARPAGPHDEAIAARSDLDVRHPRRGPEHEDCRSCKPQGPPARRPVQARWPRLAAANDLETEVGLDRRPRRQVGTRVAQPLDLVAACAARAEVRLERLPFLTLQLVVEIADEQFLVTHRLVLVSQSERLSGRGLNRCTTPRGRSDPNVFSTPADSSCRRSTVSP
jgi:hypothetical protein